MIIWKGWGILVLLIAILSVVLAQIIGSLLGVEEAPNWAYTVGLLLGGVATWFLGKRFNSDDKGRVMVDEKTGERYVFKKTHSLFFIPFQYWGIVMGIFGIMFLLTSFSS